MVFGPYDEALFFHIEKSALYGQLQEAFKIAEFVLMRQQKSGPVLWIVEAKSSSPQPQNQKDYASYIDEIKSKLTNGLLLSCSVVIGRHPNGRASLPAALRTIDLTNVQFRLALVVRGHKREWLPPLREKITETLMPVIKAWNLSSGDVMVLNEQLAQKHGLVSALHEE